MVVVAKSAFMQPHHPGNAVGPETRWTRLIGADAAAESELPSLLHRTALCLRSCYADSATHQQNVTGPTVNGREGKAPEPASALTWSARRITLTGKPIVNQPGCPPNPYNLLAVVLEYVTMGRLPQLDEYGRPKFAYDRVIPRELSAARSF